MKKVNKAIIILAIAFTFSLLGPATALAASMPPLGAMASFSVLAGLSMSAAGAGTTITGDLGLSPGLAVSRTGPWTVGGTEYFGTTPSLSATAQTDALNAYTNLVGQSSDGPWGASPWSPAPGVYTAASDVTFTGTITLNGGYDDIWIFQVGRDMTFNGSVILTGNAQPCHVFWQIDRSATIASDSHFVGTLIASTGSVTLVSGATVNGRVIVLNASLTTDGNAISGPACEVAPIVVTPTSTISVVKHVVGGSKAANDFALFVNGTPVVNGAVTDFPTSTSPYIITETADANYTQAFSVDCDASGQVDLSSSGIKVCIITNTYVAPIVVPSSGGGGSYSPPVPPLIDVVKVPSPLALPAGPGTVNYTYTLRNIGTVPVNSITMIGDTCAPIVLASGDANGDAKLDVNETWVYTCSTTLSQTHTNTVVATGWANGISATDIASATVIVGVPVVPPLIHITKIPDPLTLPAKGGMVTYTKKVTNPGIIALSNIRLTDDKCSAVKYISGDANGDSKLDPDETWTYTCQTKLTKTTTNTVTASGDANGLTARDFAIATVVVAATAVPKLPNTGSFSEGNNMPWLIAMLAGLLILVSISIALILKKRAV